MFALELTCTIDVVKHDDQVAATRRHMTTNVPAYLPTAGSHS